VHSPPSRSARIIHDTADRNGLYHHCSCHSPFVPLCNFSKEDMLYRSAIRVHSIQGSEDGMVFSGCRGPVQRSIS